MPRKEKGFSPNALKLIESYGLNADPHDPNADVFSSSHFKIITRQGVDKVQSKAQIKTESLEIESQDPFEVVVKGVFSMGEKSVVTFGSASIDRTELLVLENEEFDEKRKSYALTLIQEIFTPQEGVVLSLEDKAHKMSIIHDLLNSKVKTQTVVREVVKEGNVKMKPPYLTEMAQKRCKSRGILELAGLYELGIYGEEEADDFKEKISKEIKARKNSNSEGVVESSILTKKG